MVYVHLATGFEEIEAITVIDVLRRAEVDVKTLSITGELSVEGAHGIFVKADTLFEDANYKDCEMMVLPGGLPGTTNLGAHEGLIKELKAFEAKGGKIAAICAAPMVFGEEGLLEGKTAVIYPGMESHLKGAKIGTNDVEIDGNIITSKGPGTAMSFALALAGVLKGPAMVDSLKEAMLLK